MRKIPGVWGQSPQENNPFPPTNSGEDPKIEEDCFLVDLLFDGRLLTVQATFAPGDEILVGTHLLAAYRLEVVFPKRTVSLERVV